MVSKAGQVFDADGKLQDEDLRKRLANYLQGFAKFVAETSGR
jgi:hypothetical protein